MSERVIQFTYDGDPRASDLAQTRWLVGDVDCSRPLLDDREITFAIERDGSPVQAAITCLDVLANRFAREADTNVGSISKALSKISEAFAARADSLRSDVTTRALPFFGGRTISGKRTLASDTDAIPPHFAFGRGDDPVAVQFDDLARRYNYRWGR